MHKIKRGLQLPARIHIVQVQILILVILACGKQARFFAVLGPPLNFTSQTKLHYRELL